MKTVGVFDAKSHLSELIDSGEAVTITKHGRAVAILSPVRRPPADVAAHIRANRCVVATAQEVATLVREGRR